MKLNDYINDWNSFFNKWLTDPQGEFENDFLAQRHTGKLSKKLLSEYLPQPFLGNPLKCSAITLNLNPGTPLEVRKFPSGELVELLKNTKNYHEYASGFPQLQIDGAGKFWKRQIKWIKQLQESNSNTQALLPFAIELCHWHSKKWKDFDYSDNTLKKYLESNIFEIIDIVIKNAELKTVLSIGKTYNKLFEIMGFNKVIEITPYNYSEFNLKYPLNKQGKPTNRFYSLWKSPSGTLYLNSYSIGSNRPPSKEWQTIEKELISNLTNKH